MDELFPVRLQNPIRSEVAEQARYQLYREDLRRDFLQACGYCGDSDVRVDRIAFHIDHFAPQKKFPDLESSYLNLVYACRFCNVSKSDKWVGQDAAVPNDGAQGFVDPCSDDYEAHVGRHPSGQIVGRTPLGSYIVDKLNLGLLRHQLLWQARRVRALRDEVDELLDAAEASGVEMAETFALLARFRELTHLIDDYEFRAVA